MINIIDIFIANCFIIQSCSFFGEVSGGEGERGIKKPIEEEWSFSVILYLSRVRGRIGAGAGLSGYHGQRREEEEGMRRD